MVCAIGTLACRAAARPITVVRLAALRHEARLNNETAEAYHDGLHALALLRQHYPDFYRAHVAHRPLTPGALAGAGVAFLKLIHRHVVPLRPGSEWFDARWCPDLASLFDDDDPVLELDAWQTATPDFITETLAPLLAQPRPRCYGVGVMLALEAGDTGHAALTVALWHLFSQTTWGLGIDLTDHLADQPDPTLAEVLEAWKPLPAEVSPERLLITLDAYPQIGLAAPLLAYAFGQTGNPLADQCDEERVFVPEEDVYTWDTLHRLRQDAQEAQAIRAAYQQWSRQVEADLDEEVPALAARLHQAARLAVEETER